jgi:hypothetical protein
VTLASDLASFVRGQIAAAQVPITAVGTVIASVNDITPADRLLVVVDGSGLAVPVKRMKNLILRSGMRVGIQKFGADWVVTGVIVPDADTSVGVIARAERLSNGSSTTSVVGVLRLDNVPIKAGLLYKIWTAPLFVVGTIATDYAGVEIYGSTSGVATTSSTQMTAVQSQIINTSFPVVHPSIVLPYTSATDVTLSVLLSVSRSSGTGSVSLQRASGTIPIHLVVECLGSDVADTGVSI